MEEEEVQVLIEEAKEVYHVKILNYPYSEGTLEVDFLDGPFKGKTGTIHCEYLD